MNQADDDLITIDEAAEMLGLSKVTLRRWTRDGRLPCIRVGPRGDRRFRPSELESYVVSQMRSGVELFYPPPKNKLKRV
jgi:excisionase family DNA binding protein